MYELPEDWRDGLPDEMKNNGVLDTVKGIENLAKMAIDGRTLASTALRVPSKDASEDVIKAFKTDLMGKVPDLMFKPDLENDESIIEVMKTLGCPAEAKDYSLPDIPESIKPNVLALTENAHKAGVTQKQLTAITEGIVSDYKNNSDQAYGAMEEDRQALKTEWGAAYDKKVETVSHFAKQTGFSDDFISAIQEGHIDSTNMKALDKVIQGYEGEGLEIGRQPNNPDMIMTPAEADSRLNELMSNRDHPYWHAEDPEHQAAKDKVLELGKLAETGKKTETELFRESLLGG